MVLFGSLLNQFVSNLARAYVLAIFEFDADWFIDFSTRILINRFNGLETTFSLSFIDKNPRSILCWSWWWYLCQFRILKLVARPRAGLMVGSTILLSFRCFFWRSGLLEFWIRSYVRSHWFGCSLRPGTPLYTPWTLDSYALSWSLTLPIKEQQR